MNQVGKYLEYEEIHEDRSKMENIDKMITFTLHEARKKAEGEKKGTFSRHKKNKNKRSNDALEVVGLQGKWEGYHK